jgi:Ca-activated chloride channel family protein
LVALPFAVYYLATLRGSAVHWRHRAAGILLVAVPLAAWVGFQLDRVRSGTLVFSRTRDLVAAPQGLFGHLLHLPRGLRLVAIGLVAIALMRPQRLTADASEVEGIDIVVALDVSNSMAEVDLQPDRITAAKKVIDSFIARRRSDRIGLVIFGKEAFTQCPLTLDYRALRGMLADVRLGLIDGRSTAIGNAIGTSLNRLRKSDAKSKVIILVTDGDSNAGNLSPIQAARYAQALGVKIFTILIGRDVIAAEAPPGTDRFGNVVHVAPRYPVNPKLLEEIADATGGTPYLATDSNALERRFQAILEELERSRIHDQTIVYAELYPRMALPALLLVLLEIALSLTRFRRFP